ncbi:MAG: hypothetical protein ACREMQ_20795 [Longimicrobiales bacterium]
MPANYLEQLAAEWYEFKGFFVRRNIKVGRRDRGGWDGELDVVGFNPVTQHLVHVEASMDADTWQERERRFRRKFEMGNTHIRGIFPGLELSEQPEQIALLGYGSTAGRALLGGARLLSAADFVGQIVGELRSQRLGRSAIPEDKPILRTLQYVCEARLVVVELLK